MTPIHTPSSRVSVAQGVQRRHILRAAGAVGLTAALLHDPRFAWASNAEFRLGLFIPLSGPASLFGPTNRACAELAVDQVNKAGGILNRPVKLIVADGGGAPSESAKLGVRMMLEDKVDFVLGSHDSATRLALLNAFKGRVPYVYSPVNEGVACAPNSFVLGETPAQQLEPSVKWMTANGPKAKTYFLIGNDYVWPRTANLQAKASIAAAGGKVIGEEYVPLGAANRFEEVIARIKAAKPDVVLITLVGADNVNFNRAFASFGAHKTSTRLALLLEENTLQGIGAEGSENLYSCMSYFSSIESDANKSFKAAYAAKFGAKAPQLSSLGVDSFAAVKFASAVVAKAGGTDATKLLAGSQGLSFETAAGPMTIRDRFVDRPMYLARCHGTEFRVIETFSSVKHGQVCKA